MADFKDVLDEKERGNYDDLVEQGCTTESIEKFLSSYELGFDDARKVLAEENPNVDLVCFETEEEESKEGKKGDEKPQIDLTKEYESMAELSPDRQGNEAPKDDGDKGASGQYPDNLDEIYPEMKKQEEKDKKVRGDSLEDEYSSMKDLPPDEEE